jgi:hypothetical protein
MIVSPIDVSLEDESNARISVVIIVRVVRELQYWKLQRLTMLTMFA